MQIMQMLNSTLLGVGVTQVSNPPDGGDEQERDEHPHPIHRKTSHLVSPLVEMVCPSLSLRDCRTSSQEAPRIEPLQLSLVSLPASLFLKSFGRWALTRAAHSPPSNHHPGMLMDAMACDYLPMAMAGYA